MNLTNYVWQVCVVVITMSCSDCITGQNTFNTGLLKLLPTLHR